MKKMLIFIMLLVSSFALTACDDLLNNLDDEVKVEAIQVESLEVSYDVDTFDPTELGLKVSKSDGTSDLIAVTNEMVYFDSTVDFGVVGDYKVTIEYDELKITITVHVVDYNEMSKTNHQVLELLFDFLSENGTVEASDVYDFMDQNGIKIYMPDDYISLKLDNHQILWKYDNEAEWEKLVDFEFEVEDFDLYSLEEYLLFKELNPEYEGTYEEFVFGRLLEEIDINYHVVTFQYVEGDELVTVQKLVMDGEYVSPVELDLLEGMELEGWYLDSRKFIFDQYKITDDFVLIANITSVEYSITFIDESGVLETSVLDIRVGDYLALLPQDDVNGKRFAGWFFSDGTQLNPGLFTYNYDILVFAKWVTVTDEDMLTTLPENQTIVIDFWHIYGGDKGVLLDSMISDFEEMYPNIMVRSTVQGSYSDLNNKVKLSIASGNTPNVVIGYPEHMIQYKQFGALQGMNIYAQNETVGVNLDNYIDAYLEENLQLGTELYSLPYSKSSEVLLYNKDIFAANGYTFTENQILTWEEIYTMALQVLNNSSCTHMINYDSPANLFFNTARQFDNMYTVDNNIATFDNTKTTEMLADLSYYIEDNVLAIPYEWGGVYGSYNFMDADVCMTVTSTAGVNYNISNDFEVGVLPVPQFDGKTYSAVQQGPNIGIIQGSLEQELASWLLIKYLTNDENTALWALETGYLPVTKNSYNTTLYQDFLTNPSSDNLYNSLASSAVFAQSTYMGYEPVYLYSSDLRVRANELFIMLYEGYINPDEFLDSLYYEMGN